MPEPSWHEIRTPTQSAARTSQQRDQQAEQGSPDGPQGLNRDKTHRHDDVLGHSGRLP
eukprot:CAMPEP_0203949642 /NCGR_PEP_ID=MMETSP0359-20131031/84005_1 /ASSEMBLY_ACC=CAM_ASM_000338 /TAXON_ID=268821 /ORGANISM="Scrippsiella Hangoei, Strain SHTV-5" /LENGTH=57 /DNA_ID=CAMNT_0050881635 /DNA_START=30 /DNA_END=200 /DNA_ORIENTATION=-